MEKIYEDNISEYYLINLIGDNYFSDLEYYDYTDMSKYIENKFRVQLNNLRSVSYSNEVYYNIIDYKSYTFLLLGIPKSDTDNEEYYIYNTMVSQTIYRILDAYIIEYEFYRCTAFKVVTTKLNIVIEVACIVHGKESLSFLFKKKNDYILVFGLCNRFTDNNLELFVAKIREYAHCIKINPIFVLHCMEFPDIYEIISIPYAVSKLRYLRN